jgi:hypothetical protein
MPNAVVQRLPDGRWRVTDVPDGWTDDGRDLPPPNPSDAIYEYEPDAVRDYLERTSARDPADEIADAGDDL